MYGYRENLPSRRVGWLKNCLRESCTSSLSLGRYLCIKPLVRATAAVALGWLVYRFRDSPLRAAAGLLAVGSLVSTLVFGLTLYYSVRATLPGYHKRRNRTSLRLVRRYGNLLESIPVRLTNVCLRQDILSRLLDKTVVPASSEPQSPGSSGREAALSLYISQEEQIREYLDTTDALRESLDILKIGNTPMKIVVCEKTAVGHLSDVNTMALKVYLRKYTLHQGADSIMLQSPEGLQEYLHKGGWKAVGEWTGPVSPDEIETMGVLWDLGRSKVYSTAEILHNAAKAL